MSESYSGGVLLEDMESAKNYNGHVADLITRHWRGTQILEFGAGRGTMTRLLQAREKNVHCWEPDPQLQQHLRAQGCATVERFPDGSKKWDTIYSINVLEHIEDDRSVVAEMAEALAPGGVIIAYVPAFMLLYNSVDKQIGHHRRYTAESLKALFSNLRVVHCEYADSLGFFAGLAFKAFDNGSGQVSKSAITLYDTFAFPISRILDAGFRHLLGKNVLIVAEKP